MTCKWKVFCKQGDTCVAHEGYDVWKCTAFKDKEEPMTNEEYIRSCSTEELAEVLLEIYKDVINDYKTDWWEDSKEDWMEWLKEKH